MAYEIKVPSLGESIVEATVSRWLKQAGEAVAAGEAVVELETDKVNLEVAADQAGQVGEIFKQAGETVQIGDILGTLVAGEGTGPATQAAAAVSAPSEAAPPPSPAAPEAAPAQAAPVAPASNGNGNGTNEALISATPVAQRVAAEHSLDLRSVAGSGPSGRVTKEDVLKVLDQRGGTQGQPLVELPSSPRPVAMPTETAAPPARPAAPAPAPAARPTTPAPAASASGRPEERQRLSRRRLTIAKRLVEAQQTAAMLTTFNEVDMSTVMDVRKRRKDSFKERNGVNLGFMSFFTKAVVGALKAFPMVNAEMQGDEVVLKRYYDIGIAVGVEEGLVVPVLRDADKKSFAQIEREIGELAKKARENTLGLNELQGGTFTITNGGVYGSLMSTPILNTPQVGILGMHKIEDRPVVVNGQIVIRPMMYLALSYDHRLIDGGTAVRFLVRVKELVEDPESLLLEG
jgi:2-oxoglutarate dehydrogenase E2 component (dihydrolipoamide succinyltransferase)